MLLLTAVDGMLATGTKTFQYLIDIAFILAIVTIRLSFFGGMRRVLSGRGRTIVGRERRERVL